MRKVRFYVWYCLKCGLAYDMYEAAKIAMAPICPTHHSRYLWALGDKAEVLDRLKELKVKLIKMQALYSGNT